MIADEIREIAKQYPESKSAILPALRLAQEQYGWLSREAFEEVADALDLTPAYCMSVASFYDMFQLEPVGTHMVEVCTNICCGLVNAQAVLEAFERELGVAPGETTVGRHRDVARGRVPGRLLDADDRRRRPSLPPVGHAGRRAGHRRGAAQWLRRRSASSRRRSCSRTRSRRRSRTSTRTAPSAATRSSSARAR